MKKLCYLAIISLLNIGFVSAQNLNIEKDTSVNGRKAKVTVYTKTGEIYQGYFISQNKDFLEIETETVGVLRIPTQRIKKIESISEEKEPKDTNKADLEQINATRYIVGTSAFNYQKDGNYIRNNPSTYHRGVTDRFSIGVGTSIFALVLGTPALYVNPHYTVSIRENLKAKVGMDAFAASDLDGETLLGAAFLNTGLTVGEPDLNLTATVYFGALSFMPDMTAFYSLAGMARVFRQYLVVAEGFYIPTTIGTDNAVLFYGARYINQNNSVDLGLLYSKEISDFLPFGIPFIGVTVKMD